MQPKILEQGELILAGFSFFGDPFNSSPEWSEENEIGRLWARLMTYIQLHPEYFLHARDAFQAYEVWVKHAETATHGYYEIFVGMEILDLHTVPPDLCLKRLPSAQYAVFTLQGNQIHSDWPEHVYKTWLPAAGYHEVFTYQIQFYDARFKGMDRLEASEIDVYIPLGTTVPHVRD